LGLLGLFRLRRSRATGGGPEDQTTQSGVHHAPGRGDIGVDGVEGCALRTGGGSKGGTEGALNVYQVSGRRVSLRALRLLRLPLDRLGGGPPLWRRHRTRPGRGREAGRWQGGARTGPGGGERRRGGTEGGGGREQGQGYQASSGGGGCAGGPGSPEAAPEEAGCPGGPGSPEAVPEEAGTWAERRQCPARTRTCRTWQCWWRWQSGT